MGKAFVIIKPDGYVSGLVGEIITRFERKGFQIKRIRIIHKSIYWARRHYAKLQPQEVFEDNVEFMSSAPIVGIVLTGPDGIVKMVKSMVGPTDSSLAPPGTIRGDYGNLPIRFNVIHCSDPDLVDKEIERFFDRSTDRASY